ncbi:glycerophosphodiester phosphodiesterase [Thermomicrobium sp. 4228-Ro]|uniref:glycerophosphodiester phosphodiesterase n=1 Tax=Thermomicrobium sp. 4228-Ro TaxID=2993937 RepID=UPI00224984A5|nr:glycerophosphodiester phosphodiesterase [Thermomicrobium sp. 4228-Ro]MCX2727210.1 glycerophosphodiester phosphodiesterase [Thermomicrobium sp. 4228-Ro]
MKTATLPNFTVIAHRGGSVARGQNSAAGFLAAVAAGVPALECDVRLTGDGELVLLHDSVVPLPDGGRLVVRHASLPALRVAEPNLLTLEEFLEEFGHRALVNLDLKGSGYERHLARVVERWGHPERVYITSQHAASLRRLAKLLPTAYRGLSHGHAFTRVPRRVAGRSAFPMRSLMAFQLAVTLRLARAQLVALHYRVVTPWLARWLQLQGWLLTSWTVNDPREAIRLVRTGVRAVTSDVPVHLLHALTARQLRPVSSWTWDEIFRQGVPAVG